MSTIYANYLEFSVSVDTDSKRFTFLREGRGVIADDIAVTFIKDGVPAFTAADYDGIECIRNKPDCTNGTTFTLRLKNGAAGLPETTEIAVWIFRDRIELAAQNLPEGITASFAGTLFWGSVDDCFAVCLDRPADKTDLRSALGPAVSPIDDALFDRTADEALTVNGSGLRTLGFSWEKNAYTFIVCGTLTVGFEPRVYAQKFRVRYNPINKNNTFPKPPAGWMTWYAVRFGAGEKAVLENAEKQKEYLAAYGADTIWVDWEWYHSNLQGEHVSDEIGYMNPDPVRYPNGLRYVSDEIRKKGFVPALWVGPTCEPDETVTVKKYADSILYKKPSWCGQYFFDISDERVREEWIPAAFAKVKEWGYDALKWDVLPITLSYGDQNHDSFRNPEMAPTEALRKICEKAREVVGKDFYMLSCAGNDRVIMMAAETFDGARIGGDIFTWSEFISAFVERILRFYPFHNTLLYCDPDNVVIREEYNTMEQAKSRVSTVSLLGLPTTLGDDLRELPMDRVDLLRRALPTLDAHPKDIREGTHDGRRFLVNLAISRPFEAWNTAAVLNLLETEAQTTVSLTEDLALEAGEYLVWEYWSDRFFGTVTDSLTLTLAPMGAAVLAVRKKTGRPQILSTSRHITQGAVDLLDAAWDEASCTLTIRAEVVKDDPYKIRIYVPDGYTPEEGTAENGVLTITPDTGASGEITVSVRFNKKTSRLILSSCDFRNPASAKCIYDHLPRPVGECRVLYFANEKATEEAIRSEKFYRRLAEFGFARENCVVFDYFHPETFDPNQKFDAVYISGGNTFGTMKRIRESGADAIIRRLVETGARYIGGSAGAHIASRSIAHVAAYDTDTFGLTDFSGLGLFDGILICHYSDERQDDYLRLTAQGESNITPLRDEDFLVI